jgi:hypothetical protein
LRNETQQRHKRLPGLAGGGTIFLDEIHTMDKATQMKILRVIEDRQVTRIGGKSPIPLDIRIIAASSEKMDAEMAAGNFLSAQCRQIGDPKPQAAQSRHPHFGCVLHRKNECQVQPIDKKSQPRGDERYGCLWVAGQCA